ncbi:SDR family oxidoreductase [Ktedonobacter racemifer]|uniref:NmrA family protein n=1 Tax=Ktedonobacter racemifer DSM 44963 TaxID=485913 RepID=D6U2P1_KTERA|nr:SDR family oxidoreductase [Ktedonobacter racemifer]EFH81005.1 NmrA family protein [Ktedonobacter racemifer DSM 44963]
MILVTGATGLSGSAVIREFARQKAPVRALVRNRAIAQAFATSLTVEVVEGDMLRPETLGAALRDVDRVLMISSASKRMVQTQCTFIDSAREAGVRHIVKFSGKESSIGFNPSHFRSTWEHEHIEDYLEHSGLAWTHLRPSQFMQFYLPPAPTAVNVAKGALLLPMENARLSPVDVEDIAKVAFALLHSEGHESKNYDMTGPEALTMTEVVERIAQAIGKPFRYVNIPLEETRQAWLAAGIPSERIDTISEVLSERSRCVESRVFLDTHKAFGVRPTTFAEFARRNAAVFRGESVPL